VYIHVGLTIEAVIIAIITRHSTVYVALGTGKLNL